MRSSLAAAGGSTTAGGAACATSATGRRLTGSCVRDKAGDRQDQDDACGEQWGRGSSRLGGRRCPGRGRRVLRLGGGFSTHVLFILPCPALCATVRPSHESGRAAGPGTARRPRGRSNRRVCQANPLLAGFGPRRGAELWPGADAGPHHPDGRLLLPSAGQAAGSQGARRGGGGRRAAGRRACDRDGAPRELRPGAGPVALPRHDPRCRGPAAPEAGRDRGCVGAAARGREVAGAGRHGAGDAARHRSRTRAAHRAGVDRRCGMGVGRDHADGHLYCR